MEEKVFCIEDDENIRELICYALQSAGYSATGYPDGYSFFEGVERGEAPALVLLDIMLPEMDGMEILERIRKNARLKKVPVIMLTAKSAEMDKVKGLNLGADDYMTKPFGVMELIARVKAVLRRRETKEEMLTCGNLVLNPMRRTVTANGENVVLTYKEFEVLWYLMRNKNIALSREQLTETVWGYDFDGDTRTVDVHIRTLRHKLGICGSMIETIRHVGYRITEQANE